MFFNIQKIQAAGPSIIHTYSSTVHEKVISTELHYNEIGASEAKTLFKYCIVRSITEPMFHCNRLKIDGVKELAKFLRIDRTLTSLALHVSNQIGDDSIHFLVEALEDNFNLINLTGIDAP